MRWQLPVLCPSSAFHISRSLFVLSNMFLRSKVRGVESFTFCYPIIQKASQNWLSSIIITVQQKCWWCLSFELKGSRRWHFWLFNFNNFLWVCWFLGKNLSNFAPPVWKLHNPYCHKQQSLWFFRFHKL